MLCAVYLQCCGRLVFCSCSMHERAVGPSPVHPADSDGGERPGQRATEVGSEQEQQTAETAGHYQTGIWYVLLAIISKNLIL